ncbi:hypothetical protein Hdeb2414_s0001g00033651 [Helianthus debilis subsp. tardiflorus]
MTLDPKILSFEEVSKHNRKTDCWFRTNLIELCASISVCDYLACLILILIMFWDMVCNVTTVSFVFMLYGPCFFLLSKM